MNKKVAQIIVILFFSIYTYSMLYRHGVAEVVSVNNEKQDQYSSEQFNFDGFDINNSYNNNNALVISDPFESFNRASFRFTKWLDSHIVSYIDLVYKKVLPTPIRSGVNNFSNNFYEPMYFFNDVLQLRYKSAFRSLCRFLINSTLGLFGFFDAAEKLNIPRSPNYLDYTLAYYHIPSGFFIFVPILGPYTLTGGISSIVEGEIFYRGLSLKPVKLSYSKYFNMYLIKTGSNYLEVRDNVNSLGVGSADEYSLLKSAFIQNRNYQINLLKSTK